MFHAGWKAGIVVGGRNGMTWKGKMRVLYDAAAVFFGDKVFRLGKNEAENLAKAVIAIG